MLGLRYLFLILCDSLVWALSKIRDIGSPTSKDLLLHNSKVIGPSPYDLVCSVEHYKAQQEGTLKVNLEDSYVIGTVIGYVTDGNEIPLIKVAHFNLAEFKQPKIKLYGVGELVVLISPYSNVETQNLNASMISEILDGVFGVSRDTQDIVH